MGRRMTAALVLTLAGATACTAEPEARGTEQTETHIEQHSTELPGIDENWQATGVYRQGFEETSFWPSNGEGSVWLNLGPDALAVLRPYFEESGREAYRITVRMAVRGRIERDAERGFGHLGAYQAEGMAMQVESVEVISAEAFDAEVARIRAGL
jgi:hypothetical protein